MKKFFSVIISILIMIIIFKFSSENAGDSLNRSDVISDIVRKLLSDHINAKEASRIIRKGAHFGVYFLLATFLQKNFSDNCRKRKNKIIVLFLIFIYACTDEYHQSFVSGRGSRFTDVLIDTSGGMISILMMETWRRFKNSLGTDSTDRLRLFKFFIS